MNVFRDIQNKFFTTKSFFYVCNTKTPETNLFYYMIKHFENDQELKLPKFFTPAIVARKLTICTKTLMSWVHTGKLQVKPLVVNHRIYFIEDEVFAAIDELKQNYR